MKKSKYTRTHKVITAASLMALLVATGVFTVIQTDTSPQNITKNVSVHYSRCDVSGDTGEIVCYQGTEIREVNITGVPK